MAYDRQKGLRAPSPFTKHTESEKSPGFQGQQPNYQWKALGRVAFHWWARRFPGMMDGVPQ